MERSLKTARFWPSGGLWRHGDFLKLWAGQTVSELGSQFSLLALPLTAIFVLHASAFAVAALTIFEQLPFLLFALPAGVWVDRLARRPILIVGDLGRAVALASIPIAYGFGALQIWHLFLVAFVVGVLTVFFDVAYQSYLPSLVAREELVEGNSKLQASASAGQLGGPGLAGPLIRLAGAPYAVLVDVGSFLVSSAFVLAIRRPDLSARGTAGARPGMRAELMEGLRYVLGQPFLRAIATCTANSNFFGNVSYAILFVYLVRRLDLSATLIGVMLSCANLGLLVGAFTAGWIGRRYGVGRTLLWSAIAVGPSLLLIPAAPTGFPVPFLVISLMLFGFSGVVYNITQISLRQAITAERLQGRMNSVMRFIVWGVLPLGALLGGLLASTVGLRATLWVGGAGGSLSWIPIAVSPVRSLIRVPEHTETSPDALEPTLVAGTILGFDDEEIVTRAGSAPTDA
jgi:MFS family permease